MLWLKKKKVFNLGVLHKVLSRPLPSPQPGPSTPKLTFDPSRTSRTPYFPNRSSLYRCSLLCSMLKKRQHNTHTHTANYLHLHNLLLSSPCLSDCSIFTFFLRSSLSQHTPATLQVICQSLLKLFLFNKPLQTWNILTSHPIFTFIQANLQWLHAL